MFGHSFGGLFGARALVAYGTSEVGPISRTVPSLADSREAAEASVQRATYDGRDHASVLVPALGDGLLFLYGPLNSSR